MTHVVVTHDHDDHSGGVPGMEGVVSIAHENLTAFAPTRPFSMALAIDLGGSGWSSSTSATHTPGAT
ncbi:hypothetical protein [Tessaracoccus coleopterorum]|uniref:hypothetical protein n=1 Tax=Tessaracoccus coleopterorum TaxID=2714950 RepID=UPI001E28D247